MNATILSITLSSDLDTTEFMGLSALWVMVCGGEGRAELKYREGLTLLYLADATVVRKMKVILESRIWRDEELIDPEVREVMESTMKDMFWPGFEGFEEVFESIFSKVSTVREIGFLVTEKN